MGNSEDKEAQDLGLASLIDALGHLGLVDLRRMCASLWRLCHEQTEELHRLRDYVSELECLTFENLPSKRKE